MTRYASLDWVYVDTNIPKELVTEAYIAELKFHGLWPADDGEKFDLTDAQYTQFNEVTKRHIENVEQYKQPGGSAFNTLTTVCEATGSPVTLVCYVGTKQNAKVIRDRVAELPNFKLSPDLTDEAKYGDSVLTPSANVVNYTDATGAQKKVNFKHPGAGKQYISKEIIKSAISECDVFMLPGGVIDKYGMDVFTFTLEECKRQGKEIVLTLPTKKSTTWEYKKKLTEIIKSDISVLLANKGEAMPLFNMENGDNSALKVAGLLAELLRENRINVHGNGTSGFITDEKHPGILIQGGDLPSATRLIETSQVPIWPVDEKKKRSTNGCGDAGYAGYLIGHALGLSEGECALLAMRFSAECLLVDGARTPNPKGLLEEFELGKPKPHGKITDGFKIARAFMLRSLENAA